LDLINKRSSFELKVIKPGLRDGTCLVSSKSKVVKKQDLYLLKIKQLWFILSSSSFSYLK